MRSRGSFVVGWPAVALRWGVVLLGLALWTAAPAWAEPTRDECLMCHKDRTLAYSVGRTTNLYVDGAALAGSVHGHLSCVSCHKGATLRHPSKLPPVSCTPCHQKAVGMLRDGIHQQVGGGLEQSCKTCHGVHDVAKAKGTGRAMCTRCHAAEVKDYRESVHGMALEHGDSDASSCQDCHGTAHALRAHVDTLSTVSRKNLDDTCARCHANKQLMVKRKITIPDAVLLFRGSVHGRSLKWNAARCNDCHESHRLRRATDPASSINRANIPATCGRCHKKQAAAYLTGIHGTALKRGVTASPVCTDCHGEHMIRGPHDPNSPVAALNVSATCAHCHEATGIRETFGLPAGRLDTYRDSFHGLAARGGSPVVANCASCHGYHDILPSSDPRSMISKERLGQTCGRCHPGAGTKFKMGPVHVALTMPNNPAPYWARIIYLWLIAGTIGFMAFHNGLDYVGKIRRSLQAHLGRLEPHAHAAERWFVRMTVAERIQHALLATSFFTLVYTGFALKFPEAWLFRWMARMEGAYSWRSVVHRVAAVVMTLVSLYHVYYMTTKRGRKLVFDLFPRIQDVYDLIQHMLYLVGIKREGARFDRFGYIEKAEYWALIWGTVVMSATGGLLWFNNSSMRELPKWILDLSTVIHYYEAWLAFLAIVVWHLYMNIANPDVYPMNWTWLTGRISEAQLKHEHYLEWRRIIEEEAAQREAAHGAPPPHGTPPAPGAPPAAPPPPSPGAPPPKDTPPAH
jgi:cytochrome b subunit of formate dehydrogenase